MKNNIIFFVGGLFVGCGVGVLASKTYFEKKYEAYAEETVELMKQELMEHYIPGIMDDEDVAEINPVIYDDTEDEDKDNQDGTLSQEEIKRRLDRNRVGTNYAAVYGKMHPDSIKKNAPMKPPLDIPVEESSEDVEEEEDDEDDIDGETEFDRSHNENKGRKPRLISASAVRDLPENVDLEELLFYSEDEVLADGNTEERIFDVGALVGDCLTKYDFANSDERVIYVMNYELDTCYEVVKVDGSYDETH